ncbi:hypothetical protein L3Q82_002910 [Scortum barcoo]|uniref:Uncharacterized protein n=1 Tax=Scortum barcoo TaxID=214431 RepID=A0ACB8VWU1_9TELE|nr:hypothetical protein L3Q82_002910 [Scortum barcoo]
MSLGWPGNASGSPRKSWRKCLGFVKERRPSISPNFNFLGQLQHFQGTLSQKASGGDLPIQQLDNRLPSINGSLNHIHTSHNMNYQADCVKQAHTQNFYHTDKTQQRRPHPDGNGNQQQSLSGKLQTLTQNQQEVQTPREDPVPSSCEPVKPATKPTQLQLPAGSASLLEKRKSLTLSLTPLGSCPPSSASSSQQAGNTTTSKTVHSGEMRERPETQTDSYRSTGDTHREPGLLSPFSFTLNKLLDWGERVLLGGLFVHPVRMGQPALPYRMEEECSSVCGMCRSVERKEERGSSSALSSCLQADRSRRTRAVGEEDMSSV